MKKLILIIASTLVVGAIIAAVLFFTQQSTNTHKKSTPSSHIAVIPPDHAAEMSEKERLELTLQKPWANATEGTTANQTATPDAPTSDQEDPHVTLDFLDDLVALAIERYQPARSMGNPTSRGRLDLSVKSLNMHYGLSLEGLNDGREDMASARQTLLSYVLTPATLDFLFHLYGHECILRAQEQIAMKIKRFPGGSGDPELRLLTKEEQQSFFRLCGQKLQDIGEIFRAISANDRFAAGVENYLRLRTELNEAYYTFWGLKDSRADQENIDQAANTIKKAILAFDQGKKGLVASIDTKAHPSMTGEGDMIYIAKWAYRRVNNQSTSPETFAALGTNLVDLGGDFIRHAEGLE